MTSSKKTSDSNNLVLIRIAEALERLSPPTHKEIDLESSSGFVWNPETKYLEPVININRIDITLLKGVDQAKETLMENTSRFAMGRPANNALLWGARGMGKSSLVKAVHFSTNQNIDNPLILIEVHREDIPSLPILLRILRGVNYRCILFCDDLSFEKDDTSYKSLKALLEGGIEGRPDNVIFYATSNRRHLMSREMIENEQATGIHRGESVEESVSLSDRFGIWLGFHSCDQETFIEMVNGYTRWYQIDLPPKIIRDAALKWAATRGSRSGRVAWQFVQDLAGQHGIPLKR
tara:strand:- start:990 stop:1865 length:876 start_codon:yes stop_codon:yes gene_type:complete